jgi:transcription elongation factor GreA
MQRSLMTPEGHQRLVAELKHAKEVLRPKVVQDIAEARAHGDISENSEYEDAKERQALLEGRIRQVETAIATCEVIDITKVPQKDLVVFGATVVMVNTETDEEVRYTVVGDFESDVKAGKISYTSPIGRAIIGKTSGDEVKVETPSGRRTFEIITIEYR